MTNPETLPQLYRQTADVHERIDKGEKLKIQGKDYASAEWSNVESRCAVFLRERPAEKTPEQLRVEANLALEKEWLKERFPFQWRDVSYAGSESGRWYDGAAADWNCVKRARYECRRKPAPVLVPWSFEDQLCGMAVEYKGMKLRAPIGSQSEQSVFVGTQAFSYPQLLKYWQQLDGSPCGKEQG
jgi:hypothetical protein